MVNFAAGLSLSQASSATEHSYKMLYCDYDDKAAPALLWLVCFNDISVEPAELAFSYGACAVRQHLANPTTTPPQQHEHPRHLKTCLMQYIFWKRKRLWTLVARFVDCHVSSKMTSFSGTESRYCCDVLRCIIYSTTVFERNVCKRPLC